MKSKKEKNIVQSGTLERPVRKSVQLPANLIITDKSYSGMIINISRSGVGMYVDTAFQEGIINYDNKSLLKLELYSTLGEQISLNCKVKRLRVHEIAPTGLITRMGVEIIDPPANFISLFEKL
jgi:hypothetical protein